MKNKEGELKLVFFSFDIFIFIFIYYFYLLFFCDINRFMREIVNYWKDDFHWNVYKNKINEFPHFRTKIDELNIHFIYLRSSKYNTLPLLLIHG